MVHTLDIVFEGRRRITPAAQLDLGDLSSDRELRAAVAAWLGVEVTRLAQHSILRLPTGRVLLRIPLRTGLARLAQRVIEQESRYWVALSQTVVGVLGHPRLRRAWGSVVGSLQTLGAGILAVAGRLAGPLGGTRRALAAFAGWVAAGLGRVDRAIAHIALLVESALEQGARRLRPLGRGLTQLVGGLARLEAGCEHLVELLWPALRLLGRAARALLRSWNTVCRWLLGWLSPLRRWLGLAVRRVGTAVARGGRRLARAAAPWLRVAWGWLAGSLDRVLTGRTPEQRERDHRLRLLDSLLTNPQRQLAALWPVHRRLSQDDPLFYVHLAAWYAERGQVRDHQEMFVVGLVVSPLAEHREVGLALLRRLPPYEVGRVVDFIRGLRTAPRSLRTEVERYLREREANHAAFDGAVLAARSTLKRLYTTLHIRPSERAQAILFEDQPPPDSRLFALKELARLREPAAQAELLRRVAIPYKVATSVLGGGEFTSELAEALVARMSPQEVINHVGTLRRRGALEHPAVVALVERKLEQAKSHDRVSAYKAERAAVAMPEWQDRLRQVTQEQILRRGRLRVSTALLVDTSASLGESLEVGKRVAAMLAAVTEAELLVLAFNASAHEVRGGQTYAEWEEAFRGLRPAGATSPGAAVAWLLSRDRRLEQLVIVTDQRENQRPRLAAALRLYRRRVPHLRVVFITLTQGVDDLYRQCQRLGLDCRDHRFGGDYYALPDLLPMLSAPTRLGMLMEVLETPLPRR